MINYNSLNVYINEFILSKVLNIELFPVHSQLLRESLLVSFPLVINMLKFTRLPCLIEIKLYIFINTQSNTPLIIY